MSWMGSSGGSSSSPTQTTTTYNGVSAYAAPYVQNMLGQAQALTSNPNMPLYQGAQNADFTDLQNQSFTAGQNMTVAPQLGAGTTAAQGATNNLLNTSYTPSTQGWNQQAASDLMNPYVMSSLAPQLALQQQQQGMQQAQNQAQATQAGAFGGSRMGVQNALQNQANQLAQNSLVGNALNSAYTNAQNQFNTQQNLQANQQQFGANLGLQANQAALTGANTLNTLGNSQNAQQTNNINTQNALGTQQQQNQQNIINTQMQNFANQQNYPYQQLSYMQNMLSGLPISSSTSNVYQNPSLTSQVAGLGTAALGVSKLAAKGGKVAKDKFLRREEMAGLGAGAVSRAMKGSV